MSDAIEEEAMQEQEQATAMEVDDAEETKEPNMRAHEPAEQLEPCPYFEICGTR